MKRHEVPRQAPHHQAASAAVTAALATLEYPISKSALIEKVGDREVPYGEDATLPLGQILEAVPQDEFEDPGAAAKAVDRHWGRIAQSLDAVAAAEKKRAR